MEYGQGGWKPLSALVLNAPFPFSFQGGLGSHVFKIMTCWDRRSLDPPITTCRRALECDPTTTYLHCVKPLRFLVTLAPGTAHPLPTNVSALQMSKPMNTDYKGASCAGGVLPAQSSCDKWPLSVLSHWFDGTQRPVTSPLVPKHNLVQRGRLTSKAKVQAGDTGDARSQSHSYMCYNARELAGPTVSTGKVSYNLYRKSKLQVTNHERKKIVRNLGFWSLTNLGSVLPLSTGEIISTHWASVSSLVKQ